jgi:hypothetical protein
MNHQGEARVAGGGEIDEDICEWPHAGLLATEWALFTRDLAYGELVVVAPTDLGIQLPEDGEVVDAVLLLRGRSGKPRESVPACLIRRLSSA